jgi:hypothetical protein
MSEEPLQIVIVKTKDAYKIAVMGLNEKGHAETLRTHDTLDALHEELPLLRIPPAYAV